MADIGTVVELFSDKYKVVEKLEWNGLALVYKAERHSGETLAIAMLPIDTESSPGALKIFKSKAAELQLLVEPGIVRVTGHGVQQGVPFLELEYVDATTLADELLDGPLERDQAFGLTGELLDILGRAHAGGHFHWDLTPSNILLAPGADGSEHASIIGFGIQQIIRAVFDPEQTGPTGRGSGPAAKRYLAPELQDARNPNARADVFGVAAVLHHMLTGSPPGPGSAPPPEDLKEALAQAMANDPSHRPADAATFGFTLSGGASAQGKKPSFAPPPGSMPAPFATLASVAAPAIPQLAPPPFAEMDSPSDATVIDARMLDERDAPMLAENEITAQVDEPPPPPPPPPPPARPDQSALGLPSVLDPDPPQESDYESLAPPASPGSAGLVEDPPPIPMLSPAPVQNEVARPVADPFAPAVSPVDPFAPAAPAAPDALAKNPFESEEFIEQEKQRGSKIAAIVVLVLAIGLVIAFFVIRLAG